MKTMTAADAKRHFGKLLDECQREPVLVSKNGRPVAVMVSIHDLKGTQWEGKLLETFPNAFS